jgi:hypothetical protein
MRALIEQEEIADPEIQELVRQLGAILFKLCRLSKDTSVVHLDKQ